MTLKENINKTSSLVRQLVWRTIRFSCRRQGNRLWTHTSTATATTDMGDTISTALLFPLRTVTTLLHHQHNSIPLPQHHYYITNYSVFKIHLSATPALEYYIKITLPFDCIPLKNTVAEISFKPSVTASFHYIYYTTFRAFCQVFLEFIFQYDHFFQGVILCRKTPLPVSTLCYII